MANGAARDMLKLGDDATGTRYQEWMRQPELFSLLAGALEGKQPVGVEFSLARDPSRTCIARATPAGEPEGGAILVLHDISDLRRADRVRRDFVANVSHELKTPVGALTLLAEAIQDAADEPAMVARFAARIQHEGSRLARLVGELMELSRVQGADPMPGAAEIDVRSIVAEAVERTRLAAEQASISVSFACPGNLRVRGNEAQLATAIANLVDNAVAYSGSGTRVAVTAAATSGTS